jgi:hypothetical protein
MALLQLVDQETLLPHQVLLILMLCKVLLVAMARVDQI